MNNQICLIPKLEGLGGVASFQARLIQGLDERNIPWTFDPAHPDNTVMLIVGGTRQLWGVWRAKKRGVRIVQRLNGMNWTHKIESTPWRAALRAEINNKILAFIRRHLADHIVYQSAFSQTWWHDVYGQLPGTTQITYNGVDLKQYTPTGPEVPPKDHYRILLVEGRLTGAYGRGLDAAIQLARNVRELVSQPLELMVVGEVGESQIADAHTSAPDLWITWKGVVPREAIASIDRSAHVLFSADLNAACPNSVIEALGCGLPVLSYDTGALNELVKDGAGRVVPYGSNYWRLEDPVIPPLASACVEILRENLAYRQAARKRAEAAFGLELMVDGYLKALVE
jgi:glycosyltransferase involved in cell wall biosynthesis